MIASNQLYFKPSVTKLNITYNLRCAYSDIALNKITKRESFYFSSPLLKFLLLLFSSNTEMI